MMEYPDGTMRLVLLRLTQERSEEVRRRRDPRYQHIPDYGSGGFDVEWKPHTVEQTVFDNFVDARRYIYKWLVKMDKLAESSNRISIKWTHHLDRVKDDWTLHPDRVMPTATVEWRVTVGSSTPYKRYVIDDRCVGVIPYYPAQKEENENQLTE